MWRHGSVRAGSASILTAADGLIALGPNVPSAYLTYLFLHVGTTPVANAHRFALIIVPGEPTTAADALTGHIFLPEFGDTAAQPRLAPAIRLNTPLALPLLLPMPNVPGTIICYAFNTAISTAMVEVLIQLNWP